MKVRIWSKEDFGCQNYSWHKVTIDMGVEKQKQDKKSSKLQ